MRSNLGTWTFLALSLVLTETTRTMPEINATTTPPEFQARLAVLAAGACTICRANLRTKRTGESSMSLVTGLSCWQIARGSTGWSGWSHYEEWEKRLPWQTINCLPPP